MGKMRVYHDNGNNSIIEVTPTAPKLSDTQSLEPIYITKEIPIETIVYVDKPFEVIKEVYIDRPVEIIKEVEVIKEIEVFKEKIVREYSEFPKYIEVTKDRIIEKPVTEYVIKEIKYVPTWMYLALAKLTLGHVAYIVYHFVK